MSYKRQLEEARRESKRTGLRTKIVVDKTGFAKEFPNFAKDPRAAMTPEMFVITVSDYRAFLVGELRKMCVAKGNHPMAIQKARSVEGLAENQIVYILREDADILRIGTKDHVAISSVPDLSKPESSPEVVNESSGEPKEPSFLPNGDRLEDQPDI